MTCMPSVGEDRMWRDQSVGPSGAKASLHRRRSDAWAARASATVECGSIPAAQKNLPGTGQNRIVRVRTPDFSKTLAQACGPFARDEPGILPTEHFHGCAKTKDLAVEARHAPIGGRAQGADLCRGQEFRRN